MRNTDSKSFLNKVSKSISRESLIALLISVFIAFVFWFFKSLDYKYQSELNVQLVHSVLPEGKVLKHPLPESLKIRFEGSGWDILKSRRINRKTSVNLDLQLFSDMKEVGSMQLVNSSIPDELSKIVLLSVTPEKLNIQLDKVGYKKVPVIADVDLVFDKQFGLSGPIHTDPDKVTLTGPSSELTTIHEVYTEKQKFSDLKIKIDQSVTLKLVPNSGVSFSENQVQLHIPVEQLSEGSLVIPVDLPGHMSDSVSLIPDRITVSFQAAVSIFNSISDQDIYPYIKESDLRQSNGGKIRVYVKRNNPYVYKARLTPDFVDFIITR
ncbi:YbbR-like domain-containing protein [Bacteroidota bacterium]